MPTDNLILLLSQGPLPFFALLVGMIVSIDVFVVEFTRNYADEGDSIRKSTWTKRMRWMALWHALFHAISFFIYVIVIHIIQSFAFLQIDFFDLPDGVGVGLLTLANFSIVCFVWWTYRSKIKEDHSEKNDDSAAAQRRDMKLLVDLVRALAHKFNLGDQARGVAIAGSVAVDMLAISALLKDYLLPKDGVDPVSQYFGNVYLDVFLFAAIIFIVVFSLVIVAQATGHLFRNTIGLIAALRIAEPLAVFYIVAGSVRSLMQLTSGNYSKTLHSYGLIADLIFSVAIVVSLIVSNGLGPKGLFAIYKNRSQDHQSRNPKITASEALSSARSLLPLFWIAALLLGLVIGCLTYAYSTEPGRETHNHLVEATAYFSAIILGLTILFMYLPSRRLDSLETDETKNIGKDEAIKNERYWRLLAGVAIALLSLNLFNIAVFGRSIEVDAIALWSLYVVMTWLLFNLRCWRFQRAAATSCANRQVNDANFSEFVSALGVVSSIVALVATIFVTALKT